jgi:DNA-binding CsgD family transcriptional regulator/tetratricopeptide (TPR) repeat protein
MSVGAEVFVGRRHEVEEMRAALDAACAGGGRLVLLAGEPGIGKTRTALELTAHATSRDARIVWGRCHEEAGAPPHWPWMQILRGVAALRNADELRADLGPGASDIADVVPEIRACLPDLDPPVTLSDPSGTRFRLFGSIARFLIDASRRQALVLVLDDLHWADVPSLRLLEFLAQEMADSRLLIVGTYRETELSRRHRLSDTLGALARTPHVVRLHLSGLEADDVRRFVATATGMLPPAWLTSAIHSQTEGNPLFVREVVRLLAQAGHFNGVALGNSTPRAIRLPEGVREVIGRRLNLLPAACNEVLATAAVIGREFTLDVLVRASRPRTEESVLEALDEAFAAHIVEETGPGTFQFTHTLVRITLYDELRTGQRRRLHHRVGEAMEAAHRRDPKPILADLAHHFRASGMADDVERAIDYTTRAGQSADAALAFEEAINLFQNALDTLDTFSADDQERRCTLLLLLGDAQRKTNDYSQALETLRAAAEIARSRAMWIVFSKAAYIYADTAWRHSAHLDSRSGLLLEEALIGLAETEAALRIKLMGSLARDRLHSGRPREAKALASRAIAMARDLGDSAALATSLGGLADLPWLPHETEPMLVEANEMAEVGERANDLEVAMHGHFRRFGLLLELGNMPAAVAAVERMGRLNARLRQPFFTPWELGSKATMALMRGALDEAEQLILQSMRSQIPLKTRIDDPASLLIFTLRREQARLKELAPIAAMFVRQNQEASIWRPGLALLYVEVGDIAAARAVFADLAQDDFGSLPRDGRWATCMMYLAEVCAALGDRSSAPALYRLLLPWTGRNIVMGGGTGCWGSSDRFLGLLATTEDRWQDAERHFVEALAMNQRVGALAALAHTHCDFADMLSRRGYPGDVAKASSHLHEAGERAATLRLPMLAGRVAARREHVADLPPKPAAPDNLTLRELGVLRLLAIGRSNADIALALAIGQSTVATHVHSILAKTGCANRTEAAAYAVRHGLQGG